MSNQAPTYHIYCLFSAKLTNFLYGYNLPQVILIESSNHICRNYDSVLIACCQGDMTKHGSHCIPQLDKIIKKWWKTIGRPMNILCMGYKSPVQRGFFTKSTSGLLPTLGFLGKLYNFCNFVIIFSLMCVTICRSKGIFTDLEMIKYYQKMCGWNRSLWKLKLRNKLRQIQYVKNHFLWFTLGHIWLLWEY